MMNDLPDYEAEIASSVRRRLRTADRFDNYREITAKFDSTGKCGHSIKKGDRIGWNKTHGCHCSDCWSRWVAENRESDAIEAGYMNSCW
jgi:hypothetical protein